MIASMLFSTIFIVIVFPSRVYYRFRITAYKTSKKRQSDGCVSFPFSACFFSFFFFVTSGSSLSRQHTLAKCTMQTRRHRDGSCPAFSFACAVLLFDSLFARLLLINLFFFQPAKLTISAAIVTTLILFLVAAVATRRRRWWRLHHPFRNIGQQIYHCNLSDYDSVSLRMFLSMLDMKYTYVCYLECR